MDVELKSSALKNQRCLTMGDITVFVMKHIYKKEESKKLARKCFDQENIDSDGSTRMNRIIGPFSYTKRGKTKEQLHMGQLTRDAVSIKPD